jgi:dihydroorotate dehydrogenase
MPTTTSPIYDIKQTFEENVTYGPFWNERLPEVAKLAKKSHFLGHEVNSLFGVSACPLTANAKYVKLMSQLGYDIITYKSVRSIEWRGNKYPHFRYVDIREQLTSESVMETATASAEAFQNQEPSMANSFGIHSMRPEYWQEDVALAQSYLKPGQLMMLSLMFTPREGYSFAEDGRDIAKYAAQTPVEVFEVNLSHPNTAGGKMMIYEDADLAYEIFTQMKEELGNKKVIAKVGHYADVLVMKKFMKKTKGLIDGIAMENTFPMKIVDQESQEVFPGRSMAGVSGAAIRSNVLNQAKKAVQFKEELGLKDYVVIGIGGVTKPEHINQYLDLGVDAVQTAVGAWADPYLASKYKNSLQK